MASSWLSAFTRAGGVVYHLSALRHAKLWTDHCAATAQFLGAWQPPERDLVLVGTSAGYSLPRALFERFPVVTIAEPDPVARRLFSRRFAAATVTWLDDDFLGPRNGAMTIAGVAELRARFPSAAVLFCNVLGQLPILHDEADGPAFSRFLGQFEQALSGGSWASYHDRVSGPWPPQVGGLSLDGAITTQALMNRLYAPLRDGQALEYWDHQTGSIASSHPRQLWLWQRTPDAFHVIEGVAITTEKKMAP